MNLTATDGKTIVDVAMQHYGCYEGVFEIIQLNPQMHLSYELTAGEQIAVHDVVPQLTADNTAIAAHFAINNIRVNSGYIAEVAEGQFLPEDFNDEFVIE